MSARERAGVSAAAGIAAAPATHFLPSPELRMFAVTNASTAASTASCASIFAMPSLSAMRRCQAASTAASQAAPLPASAGGVAGARDRRVRYSLTDSSTPACPRFVRAVRFRADWDRTARTGKVVNPMHAPQIRGARAGCAFCNLGLALPHFRAADSGFAERVGLDALLRWQLRPVRQRSNHTGARGSYLLGIQLNCKLVCLCHVVRPASRLLNSLTRGKTSAQSHSKDGGCVLRTADSSGASGAAGCASSAAEVLNSAAACTAASARCLAASSNRRGSNCCRIHSSSLCAAK